MSTVKIASEGNNLQMTTAFMLKQKAYLTKLKHEISGHATLKMQEDIQPILKDAEKKILANISNTTEVHKTVAEVVERAQKQLEYHMNALLLELRPEMFMQWGTSDYSSQINIVINVEYNTGKELNK